MSKRLSTYIASFEFFDKSEIVLSAAIGSISIASFETAPVEMASASFSLVFSISISIVKKLLKTTINKKKKYNKIKLNSIERKRYQALINYEISHKGFITIINEERNYRQLKERIRMMNSLRSDTEKVNLIEEGKKIGIDKIIKPNEIINNNLKPKI